MSNPVNALDIQVPGGVRAICERLRNAGHEACAVGGAVRDALLGRAPGDWDVATSATPDLVIALFERTIPTGVQHGTVTVLVGRGRARTSVEVTTFRGEGAYTDARHPDSVTFGVPLQEDLARRDFVINAIAYDPVEHTLIDPFGGREDLARKRIRAVGDPRARFAEDGLRVMRAVRFAAVLGFELDADTEAAIPGALGALARVSQERVRDELLKMLGAPAPSRGLRIARRTGMLAQVLPELALPAAEVPEDTAGRWRRTLARVDTAGGALVRLAALLWAMPGAEAQAGAGGDMADLDPVLRRLKLSNAERAQVEALVRHAPGWRRVVDAAAALRGMLGRVGRARCDDLIALWRAEAAACARSDADTAARLQALCTRARAILDVGEPLAVGDLAISGGDVIRILDIRPSRTVGLVLEVLLARVLADPSLNTPEHLAALLPEIHAALEPSPGE